MTIEPISDEDFRHITDNAHLVLTPSYTTKLIRQIARMNQGLVAIAAEEDSEKRHELISTYYREF